MVCQLCVRVKRKGFDVSSSLDWDARNQVCVHQACCYWCETASEVSVHPEPHSGTSKHEHYLIVVFLIC